MSTKIGIIGCGGISRSHVRGYRANGALIVAVTDANRAAAETLASEIGDVAIFDSYVELLDSGTVDAVSVCTPPVAHEEPARLALEHGVSVLLEKPLAHTVEAARRVAAAAADSRDSGVILMTAFRHRFLPAIRAIRTIIEDGTIGPVVFLENTFCGPAFGMKDRWFSHRDIAGGGTLMDTSIHSVDIFRFLLGEVVEQHAVMGRHLAGIDVEDASVLILKSAGGALGSLTASWVAGDGIATINIVGQDGRVTFDYSNGSELQLKRRTADVWETVPVQPSDGFTEEIAHFLAAISGEEAVACTATDGLRAVEIVQSTY
ncbi:MAG: Gfo/Idh/MocA family oxidoreductase [Anaerolineae bacterium]|nr:Gfo/Idh/MocA family oxidoreductase [Anaerolineae bacterium]